MFIQRRKKTVEINGVLAILAAVLVFVIIILAMVYWKMSIDEKKGTSKKKSSKTNTVSKAQQSPQSYTKQSIFSKDLLKELIINATKFSSPKEQP